jgi:hypothetical protein
MKRRRSTGDGRRGRGTDGRDEEKEGNAREVQGSRVTVTGGNAPRVANSRQGKCSDALGQTRRKGNLGNAMNSVRTCMLQPQNVYDPGLHFCRT